MSIQFNITIPLQTALLDSFQTAVLHYDGLYKELKNFKEDSDEFRAIRKRTTYVFGKVLELSEKLDDKNFETANQFALKYHLQFPARKPADPASGNL